MKTIQVVVKNVYGIDKMYPKNDAAQVLTQLTGKKTLSSADLKAAQSLGANVEIYGADFYQELKGATA